MPDAELFAGGSGTQDDPYVIENTEQLAAFAAAVNDGSCGGFAGQFIALDCDIDLTGTDWQPIGNMSDMQTYSTMFMGSFDGQGHTVTGLRIETEEDMVGVGFFGVSLGSISNLVFDDCSVSVTGQDAGLSMAIGIAVGYNLYGTMDNVAVKNSSVTGLDCDGGVAGGCTADVTIISESGGHAIGGLCGYAGTHSDAELVMNETGVEVTAYPAVIENCEITVDMQVPGATHVGGLIGTGLYYYGEETVFTVSNCTVNGTIDGAAAPGAICGRAEGCTIENCTADITADGAALTAEIGTTDCMFESLDQ